jgi:membrane fusion protein (multidrug efflux system)
MDQRVDNQRHPDSAPGRVEIKAGGEEPRNRASEDRSWSAALRRRRGLVLALTAFVVLGGVGIVVWWISTSGYVTTDDAFIDTRTVTISPQLNAQVVNVTVTDNQLVEAGTVLVRLDARDFQAQVDQARAQVEAAQANVANVGAQIAAQQARIEQANKQVVQAQAAFTFAEQQNARYQDLVKKGSVTQEQAQQYNSSYRQAQATLDAANANAVATQKQLAILDAQRMQAQAQLDQMRAAERQAEVNLSRTVITAPVAGRVTQLTAAKGNYAAAGQALMMFVPRDVWVTANFKETELQSVQPGAAVTITVDAYPGRTFKGHVASIQAGSGTAFSLLPPENATGNYVKIVQRVPVKIVFDERPDVVLGPGMSVVPTVKVR